LVSVHVIAHGPPVVVYITVCVGRSIFTQILY